MNHPALIITALRIACAALLVKTVPFSVWFFCLYGAGGITDMLDGFIARKTGTCSKSGEIFDSVADLVFTAAVFIVLIPVLPLSVWMLYAVCGVAALRICTCIIGYIKYRTVPFLHTYANKVAGGALFLFPFAYCIMGMPVAFRIVYCIAVVASVEELVITLRRGELDRNVKSLIRIDIKKTAAALKTDVPAVFIALKKKETPVIAKVFAVFTVCYALSPIDLIPDFIPVLGYLDDLVILPLLVALTVGCIPPAVFAECKAESARLWLNGKPKRWYYALPIILIWCSVIAGIVVSAVRIFAR